jgi:translation elongation factor EF-4
MPLTFPPGLFPVDADQFELLRESLGKLKLNDAAISFEVRQSVRALYCAVSWRKIECPTGWGAIK